MNRFQLEELLESLRNRQHRSRPGSPRHAQATEEVLEVQRELRRMDEADLAAAIRANARSFTKRQRRVQRVIG